MVQPGKAIAVWEAFIAYPLKGHFFFSVEVGEAPGATDEVVEEEEVEEDEADGRDGAVELMLIAAAMVIDLAENSRMHSLRTIS